MNCMRKRESKACITQPRLVVHALYSYTGMHTIHLFIYLNCINQALYAYLSYNKYISEKYAERHIFIADIIDVHGCTEHSIDIISKI